MSNDVAIFLDLDNVVIGASEARVAFDINIIMTHVEDLTNGGRIVLRRAYGDWRRNPKIPESLAVAGFELQAAVRLGTVSKNLADMQMVVDAMETLIYGHNFGTYVLVTGDRDFMPLVQALRKRGKQVIGMGLKHTSSRSLVGLCDKYIYYEDLVTPTQEIEEQNLGDLIAQALDELLEDKPRVPASLLKQRMHALSQGAFTQSRHAKKNFRRLLEQHSNLLRLEFDGTTMYVTGVAPSSPAETAEPEVEARKLGEPEVEALLLQALNALLQGQSRVRASVLKQRMQEFSEGVFSEAKQGDESFRAFLERYPHLVELQTGGSTLYAGLPPQSAPGELHKQYRTLLKKSGLRVVPANIRLMVLKDLLMLLQDKEAVRWRQVVDMLVKQYRNHGDDSISKNMIGDILRLARRAEVIHVVSSSPSLTTAVVELQLDSERPFQDAVMRCDATYLRQIEATDESLDLEAAAVALYDSPAHARYLKILRNRYSDNGRV